MFEHAHEVYRHLEWRTRYALLTLDQWLTLVLLMTPIALMLYFVPLYWGVKALLAFLSFAVSWCTLSLVARVGRSPARVCKALYHWTQARGRFAPPLEQRTTVLLVSDRTIHEEDEL